MGVIIKGQHQFRTGQVVDSLYFSLISASLNYEATNVWQINASFRGYLTKELKDQGYLPMPITLSNPGFVNFDTTNLTYYDYYINLRCSIVDIESSDFISIAYNGLKEKFPNFEFEDILEPGQKTRGHLKYDKDGYDYFGYNHLGLNREGYNKDGYDKDGYDREGFDRNGNPRPTP